MTVSDNSNSSPWPTDASGGVLFLLDASHQIEQRFLEQWIGSGTHRAVVMSLDKRGAKLETLAELLKQCDDETMVCPLRVVWLPIHEGEQSQPRMRDLLFGDPRRPGQFRARSVLRKQPELVQRVAGEPDTIAALRSRFKEQQLDLEVEPELAFADFVARQAGLVLDIAERRRRGSRYKVPRFVAESLEASPKYGAAIRTLADELARTEKSLREEAKTYLKEMVATPSTFFIDVMGKFSRAMAGMGYEKHIVCDEERLVRMKELMQAHPAAVLWSHKSHVDGPAVLSTLYDRDFPSLHSMGGINMAFAGVGFLSRRSGVIFIRRTFQDNPLYKLVLRQYLGFLMEKRFPFSWAFEGTRSRVGKLMPPRLGLLKYVIESAQATGAKNLHLFPVSVSYDLISDVEDYATEQAGRKKRPESLRWFIEYLKSLRKPMGRIYVNIGEPVVVEDPDQVGKGIELSKVAFDVAVQVNKVTPLTLPSIMTTILLGSAPQALTTAELVREVRALVKWARKRKIKLTSSFDLDDSEHLQSLTDIMVSRGLITRYDEGPETVYGIAPDEHPEASYYRNTIIHYFVTKAIAELALVKASEVSAENAKEAFWKEALWIRDLFKFEFFYAPTEQFKKDIDLELATTDPQWERRMEKGGPSARGLLDRMRFLIAHATLLNFAEGYSVVADLLARQTEDTEIDEKTCVSGALKLGRQAYLQRRISSEASIGKLMYANAYRMMSNQRQSTTSLANTSNELRLLIRRIERIRAATVEHRSAKAPASEAA